MTPQDLIAKIRELEKNVPVGPWELDHIGNERWWRVNIPQVGTALSVLAADDKKMKDAQQISEFSALAREAVPVLLAEIDRLNDIIKCYMNRCGSWNETR